MITYSHKGALYVNMTNLCTNKCTFCLRSKTNGIFDELWYNGREPTREEILRSISNADPGRFSELVFCGYGEPTCRLYDMLSICRTMRDDYPELPIRLDTNGHASLIMKEDTVPLMAGLFDSVSVSLNAPDADTYNRICRPQFGEDTFEGVMKFVRDILKVIPKVTLTAVAGTLSKDDIERCRSIAAGLGVGFRLREYI